MTANSQRYYHACRNHIGAVSPKQAEADWQSLGEKQAHFQGYWYETDYGQVVLEPRTTYPQ